MKPGQLYYSEPITLPAELEVVPADMEDVRKVADESLRAVLQKQIRPPSLRIDRSQKLPAREGADRDGGFRRMERVAEPPMDLAFEILARVAGQEQRLGGCSVRKDGSPAYLWGTADEGPAGAGGGRHPAEQHRGGAEDDGYYRDMGRGTGVSERAVPVGRGRAGHSLQQQPRQSAGWSRPVRQQGTRFLTTADVGQASERQTSCT